MASDNTSLTSNKRLKVSLCLDSDSNQNIPQSLSLSYHQQHQSIIQTVLECEMHLFTPEEHLFFALYQTIPKECQNMHFRILNSRTWKWERISSLLHETNNSQVLNQLSTLNLPVFQQNGPESIADWISLLSKSELMQICQIHKIKSNGTRRGKLSELLVNFAKSQSSLSFVPGIQGISTCDRILATVKQTVGPVLKLDATTRNLFFRLYTIYFRSRRWPSDDKWMTASILSNLSSSNAQAKRVHQAFKVVRSPLFWPSRVDLLEYFDLIKLEFEVDCILKRNTTACWESVVKDTNCSQEQWLILKNSGSEHCSGIQWLQVYTPYWVLTRILGRRYEALFRLKRHHECIELLKSLLSQQLCCLSYRGRWYNELVRLVENYRDKDEARQLCKKAVADSHVLTGNLQSLRKRLARLCKGRNASASMQFEPLAKPNEESIYDVISNDGNRVLFKKGEQVYTVEEYALEYYISNSWKGLHSETCILRTIFGLLMWDIIFQPVPGVFSCPFQTSPLDIDTPFFYAAREPEIIARINSIKGGLAMELIRSVYHRHHRVQCRDVTWFPLETIIEIVKCMSPAALSGIVSIQAKTHWAYSSGGPDLVIWNPDTCQLRMIEVKSANDTLSDNQHVWLATLASFGVDTLVLNIKPRTT